VLFDLNDEMLEGMDRMRYALGFSFWAGGLIAIGAILYALWLVAFEHYEDSWWHALLLLIVAWASAYACYSAHTQRPSLEDYSILGRGIQRANEWEPTPKIPDGPDPVSRLMSYLKESDDRIGYMADRSPEKLQRNASVKGKSKKEHTFDLFMKADKPLSLLSTPIPEGMILMVRAVPKATMNDVKDLKSAGEDVLKRLCPADQAARVVLLQTGEGTFQKDVAEYANKNWMRYNRSIDDTDWSWSSPVELIGEGTDRAYRFENMYFG
jgi:hypothetical protein